MAFEPAASVSEEGEAGYMGLREAIAAESLDLAEDVRCVLGGLAVSRHAKGESFDEAPGPQ